MQIESLESQIQIATREFESTFSYPPKWIVAAPGRVNLMGEHVDYNDGLVLPMAIDRYTVIAAAESQNAKDATVDFRTVNLNQRFSFELGKPVEPSGVGWHRYIEGVIAGFQNLGLDTGGFNAVVSSSVPIGGGLASSAALEVAMATLLHAIMEVDLNKRDLALLCQKAEHEFAGVPCGVMDQLSSAFGRQDKLMLIDCRSLDIEYIPFAGSDVTILIANTNVQHQLTGGEYAERRQQCNEAAKQMRFDSLSEADLESIDDLLKPNSIFYKRVKHVVTEIERTRQTSEAIRQRQWTIAGQLMYESHASLKNDFEVSCSELDLLVEIAAQIGESGGVYGSRMTGGGFGGCTVSLVQVNQATQVGQVLRSRYLEATNIEPNIFSSRPAAGAHLVETNSDPSSNKARS